MNYTKLTGGKNALAWFSKDFSRKARQNLQNQSWTTRASGATTRKLRAMPTLQNEPREAHTTRQRGRRTRTLGGRVKVRFAAMSRVRPSASFPIPDGNLRGSGRGKSTPLQLLRSAPAAGSCSRSRRMHIHESVLSVKVRQTEVEIFEAFDTLIMSWLR